MKIRKLTPPPVEVEYELTLTAGELDDICATINEAWNELGSDSPFWARISRADELRKELRLRQWS